MTPIPPYQLLFKKNFVAIVLQISPLSFFDSSNTMI
jgi:hypothetical protein